MERNVRDALERIERAQAEAQTSRQPRLNPTAAGDRRRMYDSVYRWVMTTLADEPVYATDSRTRDRWLADAWRKEPHIAGVTNSVVSIDKNRGWWLTGGRNQVGRYNEILRNVEAGKGWRHFMSKGALSFYTADIGMIVEIGRDGEDGPTRDLYNVDPARCRLTGKLDAPLGYKPLHGKEQDWPGNAFFRVCSLPSTSEEHNDLGFCALSRVMQFARLMVAVYEHDQEQLGARAPRGLLLLQNISQAQWETAMKVRKKKLDQEGFNYYGALAVLAQEGVDQVDAKLIALSQLPANFNLREFTDLFMYGVALGYGYDPTEFWPVSSGALGRGNETEIQHRKATGKGGIDFILNLQDQLQLELPPTLVFEFERRDSAGALEDAQVQQAWANLINVLYGAGSGAVTQPEARILLAQQGIIPTEWTENEEDAVASDTGEQRSQSAAVRKAKRDEAFAVLRHAYAQKPNAWRNAFIAPSEPIVRMNEQGQQFVMWRSGLHFLEEQQRNPLARSYALEYGHYNPAIARAMAGQSFAVADLKALPVARAADEVLFESDDFDITTEDVARAIRNAKKRVGKPFSQLMQAETESEESN